MQGLFRHLTAVAVVKDLTVTGTVTPGGSKSCVGAIAGRNDGQILRCIFSGTVVGGDYIGGIAGSNRLTGLIENCHVDGAIYGNHFVGGIAGENTGVIRSCSNNALINTTPQQNSIDGSGYSRKLECDPLFTGRPLSGIHAQLGQHSSCCCKNAIR